MLRHVAAALPFTLLTVFAGETSTAAYPLHSAAVAVEADGERRLVPPGVRPDWLAGTRSTDPAEASAQLNWLAEGTLPRGRHAELARTALLDLRVLTLDGAPVAGWTPYWRYVWPRDAAFVAVAYVRTGHLGDAHAVLEFLGRVQGEDGSFQARYLPDGSGPPDDRGIQEDGPAWALWALGELGRVDPDAARRHRALLDRSADRLVARAGLPPPSSDYWEVRERRLTLGIAAPTLAGLDAAAELHAAAGDAQRAAAAKAAADQTARALVDAFGPRYPRHLGGTRMDAAVTFLVPPFQRRTLPGAVAAVRDAQRRLRRPAGGLSPGEGWKDDGVSWTPETALFALAAAATGDERTAEHWLDWLSRHRTAEGALPEKVLADGSPAAVAPLAWTAALVLLSLTERG